MAGRWGSVVRMGPCGGISASKDLKKAASLVPFSSPLPFTFCSSSDLLPIPSFSSPLPSPLFSLLFLLLLLFFLFFSLLLFPVLLLSSFPFPSFSFWGSVSFSSSPLLPAAPLPSPRLLLFLLFHSPFFLILFFLSTPLVHLPSLPLLYENIPFVTQCHSLHQQITIENKHLAQ